MLKPTMSGAQSMIGLVAGLFSVIGGVYTAVQYFSRTPETGELVAVIHDDRTDRPVNGPSVEIHSIDDAVLTTLWPGDGQARTSLREGTCRVRITHPRYSPETCRVQIGVCRTAEVWVRLSPRGSGSGAPAVVTEGTRAVNQGVSAVRRLFENLAR